MKKYLMMGAAALAMTSAFVSCSKDKDLYDPIASQKNIVEEYNKLFIETFGQPAANQNWGFGASTASARVSRSFAAPEAANIVAPYDEAWVAAYNETAKEPNSENVTDNYDNTSYAINYGDGGVNSIDWNNAEQTAEREMFFSLSWEEQITYALANHPTWLTYNADETFVRNFKITGTYDGAIAVVATEGLTDGVANNNERTVVVTGTWNITEDQRVGSKGRIIIANGCTVNVAEGKTLNMVNQARLVVLAGGKLTGAGKVEVNNGNAAGEENYNAGTIDVAVFNNNFGKFYNYGKFLVNEYHGGAAESNFYNHALAAIDHFGIYDSSTANARIFNGCQFYVKNDARIRNYEGVAGSALIVGGQLMFSSSEDGTSTPTYVGLAAGALVQAGSLYNNGTSWQGPTEGGFAVVSIGKFDYMNWEQDHPENGGYFANNIYLVADDLSNVPDGNGYHQTDPSDAANYALSIAEYKFKNIVANATGNGNVTVAEKGDYEVIPADDDFVLGQTGCTPGFKIKKDDTPKLPSLHVMAEDLSAEEKSDFDFNDVVIDVYYVDANTVKINLLAAGGTLPLRICGNSEWEVHKLFDDANTIKVDTLTMVNTGAPSPYHTAQAPYKQVEVLPLITLTYTDFQGWSTDQDEFAAQVGQNIKLEVFKGGWIELKATPGEPACKIATPVKISVDGWYSKVVDATVDPLRWAWEKQYVGEKFEEWVQTGKPFYTVTE
ncbi:MAG: hypothetical protein IJT98_02085 [Prevotella sp.]|nr:hypothetical protein [Prevotella sp.]